MNAVLQTHEPAARYLNAPQPAFVHRLDLLATAPDGIGLLRELIIALAVEGRLPLAQAGDESVAAFLKRAKFEKERLTSTGLLRADKASAVRRNGLPFDLPAHWEWVTAADVCLAITDGDHQPPPKTATGVPFLVIGDVRDGSVNLEKASRFVSQEYFEGLDWTKRPRVGDILYTTVGSLGIPVPVLRQECFAFQRHIGVFRPAIPELQPFLSLALRSRLVLKQAESKATGIAQKTIPLAALRSFTLPLPPLPEQTRIVARVDELMRLCDALEANGRLEAEQHARLLEALLGSLTNSTTHEELGTNWERVADHFHLLLDRPEAVDALEETVLQLGVRGLLVPNEVDSFRKRPDGPSSALAPTGVPFRIPGSWSWATLTDLCEIRGGATPSKSTASYWTGDIPWVSPKDMKVAVISDSHDHVSPAALRGPLSLIPPGSLLMVVRGMILARCFPVAESKVSVTINQDMKALTPRNPEFLPFLVLACQGMQAEILSMVERSTHGTCKLESSKIFGLPFPVPPLTEQRRIVARVEQLRRLCAELREKLTVVRTVQTKLAEALVEEAVQRQP